MKLIFWFIFFILSEINYAYQGKFWDISDLHLNITNEIYSKSSYGNYKSDSTLRLIRSALAEMKRIHGNPDFILVNGDNVYHGDNLFNQTIISVRNELLVQFPNANILPSLGNHDVSPRNVFGVNSKWCFTWFQIWEKWFKTLNKTEIENVKKGCFYSREISSKNGTVVVIVLNTVLWYHRNNFTTFINDPADQFQWLKRKLENVRKNNQKAFLVGHVPPGISEYSTKIIKHYQMNFNQKFLSIIKLYSDVIDAGFFAHQHTDAFKIVYDKMNKPVIPIFLSPSVTPFYLTKIGSVNPSIRLYKWNISSETSFYLQYHTIIPNNSNNSPLNWTKEYSSLDFMAGLAANHLDKLLQEISQKNSKYFDIFFRYHLSGQRHFKNDCSYSSLCRQQIICSMKHIDYFEFYSCFEKKHSNTVVIIVVTAGIFIFVTIVFLFYKFVYLKYR